MKALPLIGIIAVLALEAANAAEPDPQYSKASGWLATGCKTVLDSPADAKDAEVRLLVGPDGMVMTGSLTVGTGHADLDKLVLDAASHCQFQISGTSLDPNWKKPQWVAFSWPMVRIKAQPVAGRELEQGLDAANLGDWPTALHLLLPFAEKGDAKAQFRVGEAYSLGGRNLYGVWLGDHGVHQDDAEAVKWFRKAADQGDALAESFLAHMYYEGRGVPVDKAEGLKLYLRAASQRDSGVFLNLGGLYQKGDGVPVDYVQAYIWYRLAANEGEVRHYDTIRKLAASGIKDLAAHMTPGQIAEAEQRARDWKP